jgi:hypothetical protein
VNAARRGSLSTATGPHLGSGRTSRRPAWSEMCREATSGQVLGCKESVAHPLLTASPVTTTQVAIATGMPSFKCLRMRRGKAARLDHLSRLPPAHQRWSNSYLKKTACFGLPLHGKVVYTSKLKLPGGCAEVSSWDNWRGDAIGGHDPLQVDMFFGLRFDFQYRQEGARRFHRASTRQQHLRKKSGQARRGAGTWIEGHF